MSQYVLSHLQQLEAESIHIMREVVAEFEKPVMLFSIGKDSCVMLRLAQKAFAPGPLPFPLMHVNTTFKFQEMIGFRDRLVKEVGAELIEWINPDGLRDGINPFDHGSQRYTHVMKTEALKQALDHHGFDAPSAARAGTRRRVVPRNESSRSATSFTSGSRVPSGPNSGISTTAASTRVSRFAPSHCPTGPNSTSGCTSTSTRSRWCPFTTPRSVRWWSATGR